MMDKIAGDAWSADIVSAAPTPTGFAFTALMLFTEEMCASSVKHAPGVDPSDAISRSLYGELPDLLNVIIYPRDGVAEVKILTSRMSDETRYFLYESKEDISAVSTRKRSRRGSYSRALIAAELAVEEAIKRWHLLPYCSGEPVQPPGETIISSSDWAREVFPTPFGDFTASSSSRRRARRRQG